MIDLHVHTLNSCDSKTSIDDYCKIAIEKGVKCICFTDHIDYNKADYGYGFYDPKKFFREFNNAKEIYSNNLLLLCGVEFSEPHIYKKEFDEYQKLSYDFILGSIHFWLNDMFPSEMIKQNIPAELAFEHYWNEVYKAVEYGGFDSLAHIDFPKRYYKNCIWTQQQISDIFKLMIKNDIALEINTSSLRKGLNEVMPNKDFLDIYKSNGGVKITIGSDTHAIDELASGYEYAKSLIDENLQSVIYINRKAINEDAII